MSGAAGAAAASAAAAAAERMRREEEQEMTSYTPRDLSEDWEFKILRSMSGAFGKPEKLRQILDQEARAGWVLVEKFDHGRIRLKRPVSAKERDAALDFDAYRTYVGRTENQFALLVSGFVLGVLALVILLVVILVGARQ